MTNFIANKWMAMAFVLILISVGILYTICKGTYGSITNTVNALHGDPLIADQYAKSIKFQKKEDRKMIEFVIKNISSHPIRILGANCSCSCLMVEELPRTLLPNERWNFRVMAKPRNQIGRFNARILLYTNDKDNFTLPLMLTSELSSL